MNSIAIGLSRLRRDLNTVARKLIRGDVDIYIITRRGKEIAALVSYETALRWRDELIQVLELTSSELTATSNDNEGPHTLQEDKE